MIFISVVRKMIFKRGLTKEYMDNILSCDALSDRIKVNIMGGIYSIIDYENIVNCGLPRSLYIEKKIMKNKGFNGLSYKKLLDLGMPNDHATELRFLKKQNYNPFLYAYLRSIGMKQPDKKIYAKIEHQVEKLEKENNPDIAFIKI